ncbi:MAG: hypothetical protein ACP5JT_04995 [Thermoplasmata archaeon]|jgi:hypothetical protein
MDNLEKIKEKEKLKYENFALVTFVGFREHLSVGFLRNVPIEKFRPTHIYLFTSSLRQSDFDEKTYSLVKSYVEKCKSISIKRFGDNIEIKVTELDEIWEINEIFPKLNIIKERKGIANISAGPSSFSLSLLLWVMNRPGFLISHVKEIKRKIEGGPEYFEFKFFNIIPYLNLILNVDDQTKRIIEVIGNNNMRMVDLLKLLNEGINRNNQIPYRSLYEKLRQLENLGIIQIIKSRYLKVKVSDDIKSIMGNQPTLF